MLLAKYDDMSLKFIYVCDFVIGVVDMVTNGSIEYGRKTNHDQFIK